ncbi:hypothetical protein C8Q75DRAFT_509820 [Abortiporus biennis]|nr:hypothetical protein C8Q75DRAFT_509820 [Abortiporus biennis]
MANLDVDYAIHINCTGFRDSLIIGQIFALFFAAVFYGIFLVTFGILVHAVFSCNHGRRRKREQHRLPRGSEPSKVWLIPNLLIFTLVTVDMAATVGRHLEAFVFRVNIGGPAWIFMDERRWGSVLHVCCATLLSLVGEACFIFRCFVIFGYSWAIIIVPSLIWLLNMASIILFVYKLVTVVPPATLSAPPFRPFLGTFLCSSTTTVMITTGLMAYRVWTVTRDTASYTGVSLRHNILWRINRIILESGFLASFSTLACLIAYFVSDAVLYALADSAVPVYAIAFNLIIIRVRQRMGDQKMSPSIFSTLTIPHMSLPTPSISKPFERGHLDLDLDLDSCRLSDLPAGLNEVQEPDRYRDKINSPV